MTTVITETAQMDVDESAIFGQQSTAGPSGLSVHLPEVLYDDKNSLDMQRTPMILPFEEVNMLISL